jgi:nicotinamide-nucleotide amidase
VTRSDAWVLTIGDELLRGEIIDTNKSFLSQRLLQLDLESARHVTVADDEEIIEATLRDAAARTRVVLISGGLGPTRDDLTTQVVARTFGRKLVRDQGVLDGIRQFFAAVGREMAENNAKQADFPEGAEILPNPLGTAPGFMLEAGGALIFCMPGVPRELYRMMDQEILPRISKRLLAGGDKSVRATLVRTFGLGESSLDRELADLARDDPAVTLGFRTQFPDNLVRVLVRAEDEAQAEARLGEVVAQVRERLGALIVDEGERRLEEVVGSLLIDHGRTVAVAESCTGGLITHLLTEMPGSSAYLLGGVVAYANEAKVRELGVDPELLEEHGAVSEPVALQMARGVRERAGADYGLATTGVAGPGGGTEEKPVGTVYVALSSERGVVARRYQLMRERTRNKQLAAHIALDWLRRDLLGYPLPDETFPRLRGAPEGRS